MLREMYLYAYVKKFLQREDKEMNDLMQEYQEFMPQITIQLKKETFSSCIQTIADELFETRKTTDPYVILLLAFSSKLDEYCKQYDWYNTEFLIQILVNILAKTSFNPPNIYCIILYQVLFFFLLLFLKSGKMLVKLRFSQK